MAEKHRMRKKEIKVLLTEQEYFKLTKIAEKKGCNISEYAMMIMPQKVTVISVFQTLFAFHTFS